MSLDATLPPGTRPQGKKSKALCRDVCRAGRCGTRLCETGVSAPAILSIPRVSEFDLHSCWPCWVDVTRCHIATWNAAARQEKQSSLSGCLQGGPLWDETVRNWSKCSCHTQHTSGVSVCPLQLLAMLGR